MKVYRYIDDGHFYILPTVIIRRSYNDRNIVHISVAFLKYIIRFFV